MPIILLLADDDDDAGSRDCSSKRQRTSADPAGHGDSVEAPDDTATDDGSGTMG